MWTYRVETGQLFDADDRLAGTGYSGAGEGKNNPAFEQVHDVGPLPRGFYSIGAAYNSPERGPLVMPLTAIGGTREFGRGGFLMHGDSVTHPGQASLGCIVMPHDVRLAVSQSEDRALQVV